MSDAPISDALFIDLRAPREWAWVLVALHAAAIAAIAASALPPVTATAAGVLVLACLIWHIRKDVLRAAPDVVTALELFSLRAVAVLASGARLENLRLRRIERGLMGYMLSFDDGLVPAMAAPGMSARPVTLRVHVPRGCLDPVAHWKLRRLRNTLRRARYD